MNFKVPDGVKKAPGRALNKIGRKVIQNNEIKTFVGIYALLQIITSASYVHLPASYMQILADNSQNRTINLENSTELQDDLVQKIIGINNLNPEANFHIDKSNFELPDNLTSDLISLINSQRGERKIIDDLCNAYINALVLITRADPITESSKIAQLHIFLIQIQGRMREIVDNSSIES